jgi:hypothetical protein
VAQYADACNLIANSPLPLEEFGANKGDPARWPETLAGLRAKLNVLRQHCETVGRPYDDIEKTLTTFIKVGPGFMSPAQVVDLCGEMGELGFQHLMLNIPNANEIESLEIFGRDIIPQVTRESVT